MQLESIGLGSGVGDRVPLTEDRLTDRHAGTLQDHVFKRGQRPLLSNPEGETEELVVGCLLITQILLRCDEVHALHADGSDTDVFGDCIVLQLGILSGFKGCLPLLRTPGKDGIDGELAVPAGRSTDRCVPIAEAGKAAELIVIGQVKVPRFADVTMLPLNVPFASTLSGHRVTGSRVVPGSCFVAATGSIFYILRKG